MSYLVLGLILSSILTRTCRASAAHAWAIHAQIMISCLLCKSFMAQLVTSYEQRTDSLIRLYLCITHSAAIW
jgi:hypothetical protein